MSTTTTTEQRYISLAGKQYNISPLTMSPESIELLELAYEMQTDKSKAIKAIPMVYRIMIDCLVRGGDIKDEAAAKKLLGTVEFKVTTIQAFLETMLGTAGGGGGEENDEEAD